MVVITIKSFQQKTFKIEIEETKKIIDLKRKIEDEQGPSFPASALKLVYSGKVMSNNALVSDYRMQEKCFVVAMVSKVKHSKASNKGNAGVSAIAPAQVLNSQTSNSMDASQLIADSDAAPPTVMSSSSTNTTNTATASSTTDSNHLIGAPITLSAENITSQQSEGAAAVLGESDNQASTSFVSEVSTSLVTGLEYDRVVAELMSLGYERNLVIQALRVSFNNPNRAAEYLMQRHSNQESPSHLLQSPQAAGMAAESSSLGNDHQEEGQQVQGREELLAAFRTPELAPLLQHLRQNPSAFPSFLTTLQQTNPELFSLIQDNHRAFIQLCDTHQPSQGAPPSHHQTTGTLNQHHITISPEEKEAIERLKALGFSEVMVIQAYFACDKDEGLAANFLFSNIDDAT